MKFVVIGLTDHPEPVLSPEVLALVSRGRMFSGGKRHHELVAHLLPPDAEWIDISVPLDDVFQRYRQVAAGAGADESIIVFASGDPLFFGFANTLRRTMPDADLTVCPTFNSLQMLAHRLLMRYDDMRIVSLTGRPWAEFDRALIERSAKIGVLTDRQHTPAAIARRMLDYGYDNYTMHVGEHLGNPQRECISQWTLADAAGAQTDTPNCLILTTSSPAPRPYGLPDSSFQLLDGRERMITKMPIRLLTLQALEPSRCHTLWDVGFCTGSVSIEARLQFPHLHVVAFEVRPECEAIIRHNARHHGAPGIEVQMGDFLAADLQRLAAVSPPDAIFIGGHGGRLNDIMHRAAQWLTPGGVMVMNSVKAPRVTTDSHRLWDEACAELHLRQEPPMRILIDEYHPIEILKCRK